MVCGIRVEQVRAGVGLANVGAERAARVVQGRHSQKIVEVKMVVPFRVSTEGGIVSEGSEVDGRPALPAAKHAGSEQLGALLLGETVSGVLDSVLKGPLIELGDLLL